MPRTSSLYEEVGGMATRRAATPYGCGHGGTNRPAAPRACLRLQIGAGAELIFGFFLLFFKTFFFDFFVFLSFFLLFLILLLRFGSVFAFFKKKICCSDFVLLLFVFF